MIYVILGTTASGKTDLSLELAKKFSLPLISADAYQVYKEFILGTAAPSKSELEGVEHYFIHDRSIRNPVDVKEYQVEVRKLLDKFVTVGQDVIVSGGTFLYIRAALFSYDFPDEEIKSSAYDNCSEEELYQMLKKRSPAAATNLHPHNTRRVIRALINLDSGKDIDKTAPRLLYPAVFFAIDRPIKDVNATIENRTAAMFKSGLVSEVKELIKDSANITTAFMAIGYKEIMRGLSEKKTEKEMEEEVVIHTRQYAKRQRTFLRHQFSGIKVSKPEEIFDLISFDQKKKSKTVAALGKKVFGKIEKKRVLICGVGGVGAIVAESLARIGVKNITLVDRDTIDESNINRQVLYTAKDIGKNKVDVAKFKISEIDPLIEVDARFNNIDEGFVSNLETYDFIFDCIDSVDAKVELAVFAHQKGIDLIMCTGTARKTDSTRIRCGFLSETGEPLAKATKKKLKERNIDIGKIRCIYSSEPALDKTVDIMPSLPTVPNAAGLAMVTYFINLMKL